MEQQALERLYYNGISSPLKDKLDICLGRVFVFDKKDLEQLSLADKNVRYFFDKKHLIYHTRDEKWMAKYLRQVYELAQKEINAEKIKNGEKVHTIAEVALTDVEKYIHNSYRFAFVRDQYEQQVTKAYAEIKARNTKEENLVVFRDTIMKTLRQIGFEKNNVAHGLERSPRTWREPIINNAFENYVTSNNFSSVMGEPVLMINDDEREFLREEYKFDSRNLLDAETKARAEFKKYMENRYYAASRSARKFVNRDIAAQQFADIMHQTEGKAYHLIKDSDVHLSPEFIKGWQKKVQGLCDEFVMELNSWREVIKRRRVNHEINRDLNEELMELPVVEDDLTQ